MPKFRSSERLKRAMVGRAGPPALLAAVLAVGPVQTATGGELEELKAQIKTMQRQLEDLTKRQAESARKAEQASAQAKEAQRAVSPANTVTAGDFPGSFKLPGTDTSVRIGGYIKGDAMYTDANGKAIGDSFFAGAIPVDGEPAASQDGHTRLHARQTRFNIQTRTPTDYGEVKTYIEGDFFGTGGNENVSNSTSLRLRHAYGSIGSFLAGQTWTTFMDLGSLPDTVDFEGPAGQVFVRQGQLRYTHGFGGGSFAVAIENPEGDIEGDGGNNLDRLPDLVGRLRLNGDWGHLHVAGVLRELRVNSPTVEAEDTGWGVTLAGKLYTFGKSNVIGQFNFGDGIGRYIEGGSGLGGTFVNNDVDAISIAGGLIGYQHYWQDNVQSNIVYGRTQFDNPANLGTGATEFIQTVHLNLMWQPVQRVNLGFEVIWGEREEESGANGTATRVQFGAKYAF